MDMTFDAHEVFEIAQRIEANGVRFYQKAAQQPGSVSARMMLLELAKMEDKHLRTFARMRESLPPGGMPPSAINADTEAAAYLRVLADSRVFGGADSPAGSSPTAGVSPSRQLTGQESVEQILRAAILLEKESISFYVGLVELVPPELGKSNITEIIREEMRHMVTLMAELERQTPATAAMG